MNAAIEHLPAQGRFEMVVDGHTCECVYRLHAQVMHIVHTEVSPALQGRGIAAELVKAALAYAEAQGLKVNPLCSYVGAYMRRHPETMALHV
jgi:uncharacterized protein